MYVWMDVVCMHAVLHSLTIIFDIDWDDWIRNAASITGSAETDVKMLSWLKHKVVCDINAHWKTCDSTVEHKYHCGVDCCKVIWS